MEEKPKLTPQEELKEKLRQTRSTFTQVKRLLSEVEKAHTKFLSIKDTLHDKDNGVEANRKWIEAQRNSILDVLDKSGKKLEELEKASSDVSSAVKDVNAKYEKFKPLSAQVFDKTDGLDAVLKATRKLKKTTGDLAAKIELDAKNATTQLTNITNTTSEVETAFNQFLEKKAQIDNVETGFEAQLRRASEYAESVLDTKTKSESALRSIDKNKDKSDELLTQIKGSKDSVDTYQKESETLTKDIRNTLNKVTEFTLSKALQDRTKSFSGQMLLWGILQIIAIAALTFAVYIIFQILFVGSAEHPAVTSDDGKTDILSIIAKFLFTTPLIFAVYITTANYSHARDLRDKYAWKETVAKNFQNYIKLVKDEFKDEKYEEERFKFSMDTVRSIYSEPNPLPKKRKYNFSLKTVELNIEEEDLQQLKDAISYDIRRTLDKQEKVLEDSLEDSILKATDTIIEEKIEKSIVEPISPKEKAATTKVKKP